MQWLIQGESIPGETIVLQAAGRICDHTRASLFKVAADRCTLQLVS